MLDLITLSSFFALGILGWIVYKIYIWPIYITPLRKIPGPPSNDPIYGNFNEILKDGDIYHTWTKKYGNIMKFHGMFNEPMVVVADAKICQEINVNQPYDFIKPPSVRSGAGLLIGGEGLALVEGDVHKKQRKMMSPAFVYGDIKEMVPTFIHVSSILKSLIEDKVNKGESEINLTDPISKATLDVIGLVGFNYEFNSLTSPNELANAYAAIINPSEDRLDTVVNILAGVFPIVRKLPFKCNKQFINACVAIDRMSRRMLKEKQNEAKNGKLKRKDLLSHLININYDLPEDEKLTDEELVPQIMTFLFAGHETTSTATSWTLYLLSQNQNEQNLLREELVKAFPDKSNFNPTYDEINSLEYLNCIVREALRIRSPITASGRTVIKDKMFGEYVIPKGTEIVMAIAALHKQTSFWGPDADEFNPKRWLDPSLTEKLTNTNFMPFLTGIRSCIGNKVALAEYKILLSMFIRNFVFHPIEGFHISSKAYPNLAKPAPYLKLRVSKVES